MKYLLDRLRPCLSTTFPVSSIFEDFYFFLNMSLISRFFRDCSFNFMSLNLFTHVNICYWIVLNYRIKLLLRVKFQIKLLCTCGVFSEYICFYQDLIGAIDPIEPVSTNWLKTPFVTKEIEINITKSNCKENENGECCLRLDIRGSEKCKNRFLITISLYCNYAIFKRYQGSIYCRGSVQRSNEKYPILY